ncbi:MAG: hypothetical protein M3336_05650, partial [Chloroflexota bacterium]|nr:hypothetical protein [Chloroflexota bacterium]
TTPGAAATVPAKLFEYLASRRPVLALAPAGPSSTADVVAHTGGGWLAAADDVEAIGRALAEAFRGPPRIADSSGLARFDRRAQTATLARVLDEVRAAYRL